MHIYITVKKRFDDKIKVVYTTIELVDSVEEVRHHIIREALRIAGIEKGIEIIYMADLPMTHLGVGLASSSALTVGVLNALHSYNGEYVTARQLAQEAIEIEINRLGQQAGIQDQYAVAFGGFNRYRFYPDHTVEVLPVMISSDMKKVLEDRFMLFYTGRARDSRQIFKEQMQNRGGQEKMLDFFVESVSHALELLRRNELDSWGELLDKTWNIKKTFASGISNEEIDKMYERGKAAGALGGKILGAGGGGFLLLYVPEVKQKAVLKALEEYKNILFSMDCEGSRIIFSD